MTDSAHQQRRRHARAAHHPLLRMTLRHRWQWWRHRLRRLLKRRWVARLLWGSGALLAICVVAVGGLWWRLNSGPIEIDLVTPWLKAAMQENFGGGHTVSVGGTQIERDEKGRASLRLLDIVVRDKDGAVVARAPKAEVGVSGIGLLSGHVVAQSLNLVGAEMSIRIESDGQVTIFAGADKHPIVTTTAPIRAAKPKPAPAQEEQAASPAARAAFDDIAGALAWIDKLGAAGLDGQDLRELGLKDGRLVVDDRRSGKQWTFDRIEASLTRPRQGGITFKIDSENSRQPWLISAALRPLGDGTRAVGIEARKVSSRDILLALRLNEGGFEADLPLSASLRAEIAADGTPQHVEGQVLAEAGSIADRDNPDFHLHIDRAVFGVNWDLQRRALVVPFQLQSGGNQFTMRAQASPPSRTDAAWTINVTRDDPVIDPIILAPPAGSDEESLALNRANLRFRIDPSKHLIELQQADLRRSDTRASHNIGAALSGSIDLSGTEPRLAFGIAGNRMPTWAMKRLWPPFIAPNVRAWTDAHISGGTVERVTIAGNAPLPEFSPKGPPLSDDGLSVDIETSGTTVKPVASLPAIRDADLSVRVTGRHARIDLGRGTLDAAPGRRLNIAGGVFEVPDTHPKPAPAHASFRIDGTLPAAVALLTSEGLREHVGLSLDPASLRGAVSAQVSVDLPLQKAIPDNAFHYSIAADVTNFAADKLLTGQKLEGALLKATASNDGYQIKGDVKVSGTPANVELVKTNGADAELHVAANLDEAARRRLGFDVGKSIAGVIPVKMAARIASGMPDERMAVDADLTPVKIDDLLPGWEKPAGRAAHAAFTLVKAGKAVRFDDLAIDGAGANVKGSIEFDPSGEVASADFSTFSLSEGDKASLKADRGSDGVLRIVMRGDLYDGRNFVKSSLSGTPDSGKRRQPDVDLDIKLGTVAGHNGETLRGLDLKLSRRGGRIRNFAMEGKIGRDTPLIGEMRVRTRDNHPVVFFETADAGALFRFTDLYPRMAGGEMSLAMDPPTQDQSPQQGTLLIRNFAVRGESALDRLISGAQGPGAPQGGRNGIDFTELRVEFTRFPGKMAIRDGVVRGPTIGATIEGQIDYVRNDVHLRGTFVPFYGLNNMFGQIPIVGLFLGGGSNEGLLGINYEAVGPPSSPRLTVNPVSAIAPGLLRKFIPSPGTFDRDFIPPSR
jgi:hypothetical protein